ncbi:MAG: hypothetical protein AMS26_09510 [Bacteroides sp. SM23_62]|nr:MAG: hypothetical protein AMS26_09510 [Bacteroides sp. SM23_62]
MSTGIKFFLTRIVRYEFWPFWLFYLPMYFYGLYLALRAGSFTYFTAANPGMKYGGAFDMLKFDILTRINPDYTPRGIRIPHDSSTYDLRALITAAGLDFPMVVKPDIGERGKGVELVVDLHGLQAYLAAQKGNIILQEYISYPMELGVLYYKYPDGSAEEVTSVVIRDFLKVRGDGKRTLRSLMKENIRVQLNRKYLHRKYQDRLDEIIPEGEEILLEPIGNHNRGTCFLDGNQLINDQMLSVFSGIASDIPGFDYGRFDIKVKDLEDLYRGKGISILELNGVNSEPAHIYDPDYRLLQAYRDITRHMKIIYRISRMNHKEGIPYASFSMFTVDLKNHLYPRQRKKTLS